MLMQTILETQPTPMLTANTVLGEVPQPTESTAWTVCGALKPE